MHRVTFTTFTPHEHSPFKHILTYYTLLSEQASHTGRLHIRATGRLHNDRVTSGLYDRTPGRSTRRLRGRPAIAIHSLIQLPLLIHRETLPLRGRAAMTLIDQTLPRLQVSTLVSVSQEADALVAIVRGEFPLAKAEECAVQAGDSSGQFGLYGFLAGNLPRTAGWEGNVSKGRDGSGGCEGRQRRWSGR